MMPTYPPASRRRLWLPVGFALGFFLAQTAALIHAEIHPFHHHEAGCVIFDGVSQQTPFVSFDLPQPDLIPQQFAADQWWPQWFQQPLLNVFWARAPPA